MTTLANVALPGTSSATVDPNKLSGEGGSFDLGLITALQNSTAGVAAVAPLAPGYFDPNIDAARDDFASRDADYAVSELALTAAQAAMATQNNRTFAYVPFAANAVALGVIVKCSNDQTLLPGTLCPNIQLTVPLLAKIFTNGVSSWNDPAFAQASGGSQILAVDANIRPINQVDPSAVNLVLESLFVNDPTNSGAARKTWDAWLSTLKIADDTPTELWPTNGGLQGGDLSVANALIPVDQRTLVPDANPSDWGVTGNIAGVPADWLGPPRKIPAAAIQNVTGQFVAPTAAAMKAALLDATMDPSTNLVTFHANPQNAAAYPIPTMSYLIVPTSGLSAAKATALAAFIRFVLGSQGQKVVESSGAAPVTPAMVTAGLHVADVVAAESTPTTTTSTTSTTTALKTTTPQAVPVKTITAPADSGSGGGTSPTAATGPTLAFTGGPPWSLPVFGGALLLVGAWIRRALRRRMHAREPALVRVSRRRGHEDVR